MFRTIKVETICRQQIYVWFFCVRLMLELINCIYISNKKENKTSNVKDCTFNYLYANVNIYTWKAFQKDAENKIKNIWVTIGIFNFRKDDYIGEWTRKQRTSILIEKIIINGGKENGSNYKRRYCQNKYKKK